MFAWWGWIVIFVLVPWVLFWRLVFRIATESPQNTNEADAKSGAIGRWPKKLNGENN